MKKVFIRTFGCQMNVRDSEVIRGLLKKEGFRLCDDPARADAVIFNTCSVRQHAEDKVWSEIGRVAKLKNKPVIGLAGCMAQSHKDDAFKLCRSLDFVSGPSDIDKIPHLIRRIFDAPGRSAAAAAAGGGNNRRRLGPGIRETDGASRPDHIYHTGFHEDKRHAFVVVSEGCSNHCSYCIVPYVRGPLRHRRLNDVIAEVKEGAAKGISSFTLLGQNVNAWRQARINFTGLLRKVSAISGVEELGFITSHPKDTTEELFKLMRDTPNLKKYLHLPVQSGSDRILRAMNRGYSRKIYLDLCDKYRKIVTGGVLTTDIIVGFPGETQDDFRKTCVLVESVKFDAAFIFKYSPRPHTAAYRLADDVLKEEKEWRHGQVLGLQKSISRNRPARKIR